MTKRSLDLALASYAFVLIALFVPLWLDPGAAFYRELFTLDARLYLGGLTKMAALGLGGWSALRARARFAAGNPARFAFGLLAAWLLCWTVAQACLAFYQWVLRESTPFPSLADPLFVVGDLCLIAGLAWLLRAYLGSGLALGATGSYVALGGAVALLAGALGYVVLEPIARAGGTPLEVALNLSYPALDLLALVPSALLMRIT